MALVNNDLKLVDYKINKIKKLGELIIAFYFRWLKPNGNSLFDSL
jgi:hypothetical protein